MKRNIPERHGLPWPQSEDSALYTERSSGMPIDAIARRHKRTERSIECRMELLERKWDFPFAVKETLTINGIDYLSRLATARLRVNACKKDQARWALDGIHRLASSHH